MTWFSNGTSRSDPLRSVLMSMSFENRSMQELCCGYATGGIAAIRGYPSFCMVSRTIRIRAMKKGISDSPECG